MAARPGQRRAATKRATPLGHRGPFGPKLPAKTTSLSPPPAALRPQAHAPVSLPRCLQPSWNRQSREKRKASFMITRLSGHHSAWRATIGFHTSWATACSCRPRFASTRLMHRSRGATLPLCWFPFGRAPFPSARLRRLDYSPRHCLRRPKISFSRFHPPWTSFCHVAAKGDLPTTARRASPTAREANPPKGCTEPPTTRRSLSCREHAAGRTSKPPLSPSQTTRSPAG